MSAKVEFFPFMTRDKQKDVSYNISKKLYNKCNIPRKLLPYEANATDQNANAKCEKKQGRSKLEELPL
jgi:hypothetical protein